MLFFFPEQKIKHRRHEHGQNRVGYNSEENDRCQWAMNFSIHAGRKSHGQGIPTPPPGRLSRLAAAQTYKPGSFDGLSFRQTLFYQSPNIRIQGQAFQHFRSLFVEITMPI
jgi:hypothetical protein